MSLHDTVHQLYGNPVEFIRGLRSRMLLHNVSSASLARRSGISAPHISRYMNGKTKPTMRTMLILDEALEQIINDQ